MSQRKEPVSYARPREKKKGEAKRDPNRIGLDWDNLSALEGVDDGK